MSQPVVMLGTMEPLYFMHDGTEWRVSLGQPLARSRPVRFTRNGRPDHESGFHQSELGIVDKVTDEGGYYLVYYGPPHKNPNLGSPFMMGKHDAKLRPLYSWS